MKKYNLILKKGAAIALALTILFSGTTVKAAAHNWKLTLSKDLPKSQGTARIYMEGDRFIQARIKASNANNYKTKEGNDKYLWASIVYNASSKNYNEQSVKSSKLLLASKYTNKQLVAYGIPSAVYEDKGRFKASTYTSNDVRYKLSDSISRIIANTLIYYK